MTLFNTDGMVFIGPGSEWFWTALSGIVLAGTALAIYRQLVDARGAAALSRLGTLLNTWQSPTLVLARLRVMIALRDGKTLEPGDQNAAAVFFFIEGLAALRDAGGYSYQALYNEWGWVIRPWWRMLEPQVRAEREFLGFRVWQGFEDLEMACRRIDEKSGLKRPVLEDQWTTTGRSGEGVSCCSCSTTWMRGSCRPSR